MSGLASPVWGWGASYGSTASTTTPLPVVIVGDDEAPFTIYTGAQPWPRNMQASECDFYLERNRIINTSPLSRTTQTLDRPGKRWRATYRFRNVGNDWGRRYDALLDRGNSFLMWDHARPRPKNGVLTDLTIAADAVRGATVVVVTGLTPSVTHLVAGDYIGIDGALYRLLYNIPADSAGVGVAYLNRGLREAVEAGTEVNVDHPVCEMILQDDNQPSRTVTSGFLYEYVLTFIEAMVEVN